MKPDTTILPDDHDALKAMIIEFAEHYEASKKPANTWPEAPAAQPH